jgi:hypothetical protein
LIIKKDSESIFVASLNKRGQLNFLIIMSRFIIISYINEKLWFKVDLFAILFSEMPKELLCRREHTKKTKKP